MGFAQEMENLGQGMVSSFDNRINDVKRILSSSHTLQRKLHNDNNGLFKQTHNFLNNFRSEHKDMSRKQNQSLRNFTKELHNKETNGQKERTKFCRNTSQGVENYLEKCDNEQRKTHNELMNAHKNFQRAIKEMARHRAAVTFPTYRAASGRPEKSETPKKRGRRKKARH